jgi:hypothetical protein
VHSALEFRYLRDVERGHGLPTAQRQAQAAQNGRLIYRDALYRKYGVAVELDGTPTIPQSSAGATIAGTTRRPLTESSRSVTAGPMLPSVRARRHVRSPRCSPNGAGRAPCGAAGPIAPRRPTAERSKRSRCVVGEAPGVSAWRALGSSPRPRAAGRRWLPAVPGTS